MEDSAKLVPVATERGSSGRPIDPMQGLSEAQVLAEVEAGRVNSVARTTGRTVGEIIRANVLTRFNAILGTLFVVVLVVGPLQDALFGIVLVVNTAIGIAQEIRSKRVLDNLAVLNAPRSRVVRAGQVVEVPLEEVVLGDVLEVRRGDQIPVDAEVVTAEGLEVDESLLTGEPEAVAKNPEQEVLSGSFVVAGVSRIRATEVGELSYARRLESQARRFSLIRSDLQQGTNQILRLVTWVMVPVGIALLVTQLFRSHQSSTDALRASVAGVAAMVPEGLVLLTSMAFAVGAIRLAGRRVLVQELAAVEGLARVDVLCIDKTGTLTQPGLQLSQIEVFSLVARAEIEDVLSQMAVADPAPNSTISALSALHRDDDTPWPVQSRVAFSSSRKWSAVTFDSRGTWVLGAPQIVAAAMPGVLERATIHERAAQRVLVLARSPGPLTGIELPADLEPVALVLFAEELRADAASTVTYLLDQGITIKVVSGDAPGTVTQVAQQLGLPSSGAAQDVSGLEDEALQRAVGETNFLCRVKPEQKLSIVKILQRQGFVVAMVGDGVNDVQALKQSDLGIAMGSGSPSSRSVARIVLLDSTFSTVPSILGEGRRVVANIERVANLFVTKTVYAALLAAAIVLVAVPYPFFPRHLTIISTLTIGVPGFFLAFASETPRAIPGFTKRVLRFTLPAGVVAACATLTSYLVTRSTAGSTIIEARTAALLSVFGVAIWVLVLVSRPLNVGRVVLVALMVVSFVSLFAVALFASASSHWRCRVVHC